MRLEQISYTRRPHKLWLIFHEISLLSECCGLNYTLLNFFDQFIKLTKMQSNTVITRSSMTYITAMTETEYKSEFEPPKYIQYLTLTGDLWAVFCKDLGGY